MKDKKFKLITWRAEPILAQLTKKHTVLNRIFYLREEQLSMTDIAATLTASTGDVEL